MADAEHTQQVVKWYQTILGTVCGYLDVPVNGNHNDPLTKSAFRDFQQAHALEASGFLTVESNFAMNQAALEWTYRKSIDTRIGKFSDALREQIKEFQSDYGLAPDGKVGPQTMEKMVSVLNGTLLRPYAYLQPEFSSDRFLGVDDAGVEEEITPAQTGAVTSAEPGVIGTDDREPQSNTIREPNRWICLLDVGIQTWKLIYDRKDITPAQSSFIRSRGGTGLLISPRHILTAAHVLKTFAEQEEKPIYSKLLAAEVVIAAPGYNGGFGDVAPRRLREPYGVATAKKPFWYPAAYSNVPNPDPNTKDTHSAQTPSIPFVRELDSLDFALIELPDPIDSVSLVQTRRFFLNGKWQTQSQKLPPLGYWGARGFERFEIHATTPAQLDGLEIRTIGYPSQKPHVETKPRKRWMQWMAKGVVDNARGRSGTDPFLFVHTADTTSSQSGSPVWTVSRSGDKETCSLVGIITSVVTIKNGPEYHRAVAMTDRVLQTIQQWAPKTFCYRGGKLTVKKIPS